LQWKFNKNEGTNGDLAIILPIMFISVYYIIPIIGDIFGHQAPFT
jgi:hypothetical protein